MFFKGSVALINSPNHQCQDNCEIAVGDAQQGYDNIRQEFERYKVGSQVRAIILNPLHPDLPKLPIVIHATCNQFDTRIVQNQWERLEVFYNAHLKDVLGPLIGHSSDGDSRRRKLMLQRATSEEGERYRPIPMDEGFVFSYAKTTQEDVGRNLFVFCS